MNTNILNPRTVMKKLLPKSLKNLIKKILGIPLETTNKATLIQAKDCFRLMLDRKMTAEEITYWEKRCDEITKDQLLDIIYKSKERRIKRSPKKVKIHDFYLFASEDDWVIGSRIANLNEYEPQIIEQFKIYCKEGMNVLDIGANIGIYTMLAAKIVGPKGKVFAYEPYPNNCTLIRKSLLENQFQNVTVFQNAVSKEEEFIFLDSEPGGSNCMSIKADSNYVPELIVQSVTVDDTIPKEMKIDLIKIDIEGFEGIAIQGMMKTLTNNRPIVFMEFFPGMIEKFSKINPLSYLETFQTLGYEFKIIPLPNDNKKSFTTKSAEEALTSMGSSFMVDIIATQIK